MILYLLVSYLRFRQDSEMYTFGGGAGKGAFITLNYDLRANYLKD